MRVAVFSDLHVHLWTEFDEDGSRLRRCLDVFTQVRLLCEARGIGAALFGGDLFHKRGVVNTLAFNLVVDELVKFRDAGIALLVVDGNHDHADRAGTTHPLTALAQAGLVLAVPPDVGWTTWELEGDGDLAITGFSYCDNRDALTWRVEAAADAAPRGVHRVGMFHHGFAGARVGSALEYQVREDIAPPKRPKAWGLDFMFSGHYHARQPIGDHEHAWYVGSPLEHVRGEGGTDKGILVYDSAHHGWSLERTNLPRFVTLTQAHIDVCDFTTVAGNYVDVQYTSLPSSGEAFVATLRKAGAVAVKAVPLARLATKPTTARLAIDTSLDTKTVITRYLDYRKTDPADVTELLRLGLDLYNRAAR